MKRYLFDVRPDGSIAARYYFDCRDIPAQPLPADATRLAIEVTGEETPEAMALLMEAHHRPEAVVVRQGILARARQDARPIPAEPGS